MLNFSSAVSFAAYDLFSGVSNSNCAASGYPTSWALYCKESFTDEYWAPMDTRTNVSTPTSGGSSYSLSAGSAGFALVDTYPVYSSLSVGTPVSTCKFVFSATVGGGDMNLGEIKFYDSDGVDEGLVTAATNPGGLNSYAPDKVHDGYLNSNCWNDVNVDENVANSYAAARPDALPAPSDRARCTSDC